MTRRATIIPRPATAALPSKETGRAPIKALYLIHYNGQYDNAGNTRPEFTANPQDNPDKGEFVKASAHADTDVFTTQIGTHGRKETYRLQSGR